MNDIATTIHLIDVLQYLIEKGPGRTELQLSKAIYGEAGVQQRVNQDCRLLEGRGLVERRGEPFTYWPAASNSASGG